MNSDDLKKRTKAFGLHVLQLVNSLPSTTAGRAIGAQLVRSGTSVGANANYRAACRARSKAEFIAKIGVVIEEADESAYWMEMIHDGGLLPEGRLSDLHKEAEELIAIFTASARTAKGSRNQSAISRPQSAISNPQSAIS